MAKRTLTRQRIAQINLGGQVLREASGDVNDERAADRAGVDLSKRCHWDGYLIMVAAGSALEDANFHKEAAIVRKMAEDVVNPTTEMS
jgi:hypothetical protein